MWVDLRCTSFKLGSRGKPRTLPGSPHRSWVGQETLPELQALGRTLVMLAVGFIQVGAQILTGRRGRSRRENWRQPAGQAPSLGWRRGQNAAVAARRVADEIHQRVLEVVFVQGHALEQVVEELRRHCCIDARTAGHKHMDLVHTLNVASCKPLIGFPVKRLSFCRMKMLEVMQWNQSSLHGSVILYPRTRDLIFRRGGWRCAYLGFDFAVCPPPFSLSSPAPLRSPSWNESVETDRGAPSETTGPCTCAHRWCASDSRLCLPVKSAAPANSHWFALASSSPPVVSGSAKFTKTVRNQTKKKKRCRCRYCSTLVSPLALPFCPFSEARSRTHLRPRRVRCGWTGPREPCWSKRRVRSFYRCCFFPPGVVSEEAAAGRRNRFPEEQKNPTNSQPRRGALCLLCSPKGRAAGAEWLLLVFIGAY